jgi:hypothetical protein
VTKKAAKAYFDEWILPHLPDSDKIMIREEWGTYTDILCRNKQITMKQYETWENPY